jgi:hypothetical protein
MLNLMWCVKTFSSVLKKSASPLTVRSLMIFRVVTAVYCRHNKKRFDKFSAHIAAIFNAKSRGRYINHKTFLSVTCKNDISTYAIPFNFRGIRRRAFKF